MSWKLWTAFILGAIVIIVPLNLLGVHAGVTFVITFTALVGGYYFWWWSKSQRLTNILEDKCNPMEYIEACKKYSLLSKKKAFQDACNLNIAVGYMEAGQYDKSGQLLHSISLDGKGSYTLQLAYHLACFAQCINTDNMQEAKIEYENHIKSFSRKKLPDTFLYALEVSVLEYNYKLNESAETAKFYLDQLDYLYNSYKPKLTKRLKLKTLYNQACLEQEIGKTSEAAEKFKQIIESGNGLNIVEQSKLKLSISQPH